MSSSRAKLYGLNSYSFKVKRYRIFSSSFADDVMALVQLLWWGANWSQRCRNLRFFPLLFRQMSVHTSAPGKFHFNRKLLWRCLNTRKNIIITDDEHQHQHIFSAEEQQDEEKQSEKLVFIFFYPLWSSTWKSSQLVGCEWGCIKWKIIHTICENLLTLTFPALCSVGECWLCFFPTTSNFFTCLSAPHNCRDLLKVHTAELELFGCGKLFSINGRLPELFFYFSSLHCKTQPE